MPITPPPLSTPPDSDARRERLRTGFRLSPGPLEAAVARAATHAERAAEGLWRLDPTVWSSDPATIARIANRLGWLTSPALMKGLTGRIRAFAETVRRDGFTDVVLLGMGGSSLAPEVLRAVVGVGPGWPRFHMLDSTDPAAVVAAATPPATTLYVLASKSGTTIEPNSLAAHFREHLVRGGVANWAAHMVAITDEGTALAARARAEGFREVFINPSDIGGRYSVLSCFGLVPAALMGQDIDALLDWGLAMLEVARDPTLDVTANPAVGLGLAMGVGALAGRDKLTLRLPTPYQTLGLWVEQLVAESTGKHGKGVVPIAGEADDLAPPSADRLVVTLAPSLGAAAGDAPTVDLAISEPLAIGAEFVRWEIATAIAGALLEINPFDEPNVQQAKDATGVLLARYRETGLLAVATPDARTPDGATLVLTSAARSALGPEALRVLSLVSPGDYVGILAYVGPDPALAAALAEFRREVHARTGVATMWAYGPRYLHSTGQLHKGGPPSGVFVLVTTTPAVDLPIPGEPFTFGTLELAQALGDFSSLDAANRRAVHLHLPRPDSDVLRRALDSLRDALPAR